MTAVPGSFDDGCYLDLEDFDSGNWSYIVVWNLFGANEVQLVAAMAVGCGDAASEEAPELLATKLGVSSLFAAAWQLSR